MGQARPPRRAVLVADPRNRNRKLRRSRGWSGEAAALDAVRLLDTDTASAEIADLAGFFAVAPGSWAVVRGGRIGASPENGSYWRDALVLGQRDLAQLRRNPFRVVTERPPEVPDDDPYAELPTPALGGKATVADDLNRLRELHAARQAGPQRGDIVSLLAAVLESDHTLVTRSPWSYDDLELLILLLPSPVRAALTFHSHATSLPAPPLPRLVLTALTDEAPFEPQRRDWGHRLPHTRRAISVRARRAATELIALLDELERLGEAHVVYEGYVARFRPAPGTLLDEVETVLRFARVRSESRGAEATGAIAALEESIAAHGGTAHPEPQWLFELLRDGFLPEAIGAVVAQRLRHPGADAAMPAFVIEHFSNRRASEPEQFAAFTRPIEEAVRDVALIDDSADARRIRTLLLLVAASRADIAGLVASLDVPVDREAIEKLGGLAAWVPPTDEGIADAMRALVGTHDPAKAADAVRALDAIRAQVPATQQIRLVELGLAYTRWAFQNLPEDRWEAALPIATAAVEFCIAVTSANRVSLTGQPYNEHVREMLSRSMTAGSALDLSAHTESEIFFGFLGLDASRSRLARRELAERADALTRAVHARFAKGAEQEGTHWSFALLERVARAEIDVQYVRLALQLLALCAGDRASRLLRAYIEKRPTLAPVVLANSPPSQTFAAADISVIAGIALDAAIGAAMTAHDLTPVTSLCERLRADGVQLGSAQMAAVEDRLRALIRDMRWNSSRALGAIVSGLNKALTPILTPDALPILQRILNVEPYGGGVAKAQVALANEFRTPLEKVADYLVSRPGAMVALAFFSAAAFVMGGLMLLGLAQRALAFGPRPGGVAPPAAAVTPPVGAIAMLANPEVIATRLEEARYWAQEQEWRYVVDALRLRTVDRAMPQAFAWDSLLALGAFRQATTRGQAGDSLRVPLLRLSLARANLALQLPDKRQASVEYLHLLRAEACIAGPLDCEAATVSSDLQLASKSTATRIRRRAEQLLQQRQGP